MNLDHAGRRVLITAGGKGIGLAMARAFREAGALVHICDSNAGALAAVKASGEGICTSLCDVTDRDAVAGMMDAALTELGGLDTLINNAGIPGPTGRVDRIAPDEWDRTLAVNITGQFNVTRLAIPALERSNYAAIICMSSAAGRVAFPNRSAYAASKWAVIGFMKTIAAELGDCGIRVNAILPGMVDGDRIQMVIAAKAVAAGVTPEEITQRALAGISIKDLVAPQDLAALALFLASDAARSISGQAISVDNDLQFMV